LETVLRVRRSVGVNFRRLFPFMFSSSYEYISVETVALGTPNHVSYEYISVETVALGTPNYVAVFATEALA
jgi:hypothetical protein